MKYLIILVAILFSTSVMADLQQTCTTEKFVDNGKQVEKVSCKRIPHEHEDVRIRKWGGLTLNIPPYVDLKIK